MASERSVGGRLDRIAALDDAGAPAGLLLDELRVLVREATAWVDGDERAWPGPRQAAARAVVRLHATLDGESRQL